MGGAVSDPVWGGSKWLLAFSKAPVTSRHSPHSINFLQCRPLNDRKRAALNFFKIDRLFFLLPLSDPYFCFSASSDERQRSHKP